MNSLSLDANNDLMLDSAGNLAMVSGSQRLAQDVACAIRTVAGEVIYDETLGIRWFDDALGQTINPALIKADCEAAALTVPGVQSVQVFLTGLTARSLSGQVQITGTDGSVTTASF